MFQKKGVGTSYAGYVIPGFLNNKCHFIVTPSKPKASMFQVG